MQNYTQRLQQIDVIRYDGANAAEVAEAFDGTVNEDGTPVLALYGEGSAATIPVGNYVYRTPDGYELKSLEPWMFDLLWRPTSSTSVVASAGSGTTPLPPD